MRSITDITFGHILFFLLGFTIFLIFYLNKKYNSLKLKYKKLEKEKIPFSKDDHITEVTKLKNSISKLTKNNKELEANCNTLKKYLGIVNKNEYGVFKTKLVYDEEKFIAHCGFIVTQRGKNKVKISVDINDIRSNKGKFNIEKHKEGIKNFIDGWYDINDPEISWIEPDESVKREISIDNLLT